MEDVHLVIALRNAIHSEKHAHDDHNKKGGQRSITNVRLGSSIA